MSKRRRDKKPNLPEATLKRARRQIQQEGDETGDTQDTTSDDSSQDDSVAVERAARRRRLSPVQLERSRERGELEVDVIEDMLANPTDVVTEEQLAQQYGHVLADLRNMGILAAVLMVVMVVIAQLL